MKIEPQHEYADRLISNSTRSGSPVGNSNAASPSGSSPGGGYKRLDVQKVNKGNQWQKRGSPSGWMEKCAVLISAVEGDDIETRVCAPSTATAPVCRTRWPVKLANIRGLIN